MEGTTGYDVCYKIRSARLFFRAITRALGVAYTFLNFGEVHYADEIDIASPEAGIHPAWVKRRTGYLGQAKVRAVWEMNSRPDLKFVLLPTSGCAAYCEEHARLV